jgi:hypothetical protein
MSGDDTGVVVPADPGGRRSSSVFGRAIVTDALRGVDAVGALGAERETNWRRGYLVHFRLPAQQPSSPPLRGHRRAASVHGRSRAGARPGSGQPHRRRLRRHSAIGVLLPEQRRPRQAPGELRATLPIGRVVGPADVAALAVHIMTNTALTGATCDIDGGQQFIAS